jgi:hypothetical protein
MRGDTIFQVFGLHEGRDKDVYFGAFRTTEEADAEIKQLKSRLMNGENWAQRYHSKGFVIRPTVVATEFEIPSLPKLRDKYVVTPVNSAIQGPGNKTRSKFFRAASLLATMSEYANISETTGCSKHLSRSDRGSANSH